ncbi:phage scaffolding protein [Sporosarcina sp. P17b]|uniref:phage scaffolding protein n=1 Tax=Sporosarcina sp. P17b TaxID=2048260 RepID=UPI000C1708E4|nr:phage scaffolding protein [Sporosarcina sp. P17b]PIC73334.1 scaffolding protein [Sporosarcina sp. P17b]
MKELLTKLSIGESTVEDVLQAIEEDSKDRVPRSRLNDKNDEIKELKEQLTARDTQLESLKSQTTNHEEMTSKIQELQLSNEKVVTEYEAKLQKKDFDSALEGALRTAKVKNSKAVKALLDIEAMKLTGGTLAGLEEQLKAIKLSDDYLFEADGIKGRTPTLPSGGRKPSVTKDQFEQMPYNERTRLYTENPELYQQLTTT